MDEIDITPTSETETELEPIDLAPEQYKQYRAKFKVAGQDREATLDEIIKQASLAEGSRANFDKAASERKKAEAIYKEAEQNQENYQELIELLSSAQKDPRVFKQIIQELGGQNLNDFITEYITERAEEEALSPDQKKLKEYEAELAKYESLKEEKREEQNHKRGQQVYNAIGNEFADAISTVEGVSLDSLQALEDTSPQKQAIYLSMERAIVLAQKQLREHGEFEPLEKLYRQGARYVRSLTALGRNNAMEDLSTGKTPMTDAMSEAFSKQQVAALRRNQGQTTQSASTPVRINKGPMTIKDFFGAN